MTAREFEQKFYQIERIVIVLRCPPDGEDVGEYGYVRAAPGDTTLAELRAGRLACLKVPYVIHDGAVEEPHGRTRLSTIRESYM